LSSNRLVSAVWRPAEGGWRLIVDLITNGERFKTVNLANDLFPPEYNSAHLYILPGLIDSHVHLAGDSTLANRTTGLDEESAHSVESLDEKFNRVLRNLRVSLSAGVTTLCDMGNWSNDSLQFLQLLEDRRRLGDALPRVYTAGGFLTREGGHASKRGMLVPDLHALLETIRRLVSKGASFIKIMNDPIVFTFEEINAARSLTNDLGVPLLVHTYTDQSAYTALQAQVDRLEHPGSYTAPTIELAKMNNVFVVTTFIAAFDTVADPVGCCADTLFIDTSLPLFKGWYDSCCECIPVIYKKGVRLLCGTDAGFPGTDFDSLPREIMGLEMLGIPITDGIKSATVYAAIALKRETEIGDIQEGGFADYVVFTRNPLIGRKRLRQPAQVFCGGKEASLVCVE
jgi:imidazolonepropionase-like amidohydrolase